MVTFHESILVSLLTFLLTLIFYFFLSLIFLFFFLPTFPSFSLYILNFILFYVAFFFSILFFCYSLLNFFSIIFFPEQISLKCLLDRGQTRIKTLSIFAVREELKEIHFDRSRLRRVKSNEWRNACRIKKENHKEIGKKKRGKYIVKRTKIGRRKYKKGKAKQLKKTRERNRHENPKS